MSPLKTIREADARRMIKIAFLAGFLAMVANAAAIIIFVARTDSSNREACLDTNGAVIVVVEEVINTFNRADPGRTPEEQERFDEYARDFHADVARRLPAC